MGMVYERKIIEYILYKTKCSHPFRISRILLLSEWDYFDKYREKLTSFRYVAEPFAFYVEGLKDIIDNLIDENCAVLRQEKKCIEYICSQPMLPGKIREIVDTIIDKTSMLSDHELNRLVVNDKRYRGLLSGDRL